MMQQNYHTKVKGHTHLYTVICTYILYMYYSKYNLVSLIHIHTVHIVSRLVCMRYAVSVQCQ